MVIAAQDCVLVLGDNKERESQGNYSLQPPGLRKRNPSKIESAASKGREEFESRSKFPNVQTAYHKFKIT